MSFNIALSGLNATNSELNTISNNIANASTFGFKGARTEFSSVYSGMQASGVEVASISQNFDKNGSVINTGRAMDIAINGNGFFVTKDHSGQTLYTRAGIFAPDKNNYVVANNGAKLQGYSVDSNNQLLSGMVGDIKISNASLGAKATDKIDFVANFDVTSPAITAPFNASDPKTFNSSYTTKVYDSLGNGHTVTQYFTKIADNTWQINMEVDGGSTALTAPTKAQTVTFDAEGKIVTIHEPTTDIDANGTQDPTTDIDANGTQDPTTDIDANGTQDPTTAIDANGTQDPTTGIDVNDTQDPTTGIDVNGTQDSTTAIDTNDKQVSPKFKIAFDAPGANSISLDIDLTGTTQFGAAFSVSKNNPNGYGAGELKGIRVEDNGEVYATYTNGQSLLQGQVVLADFANPQGLTKVSGTAWTQSFSSGSPAVGTPRTGVLGNLTPGALEGSNVDLTNELVSLMTAQRNYQANAKTISTSDKLTQALFNAV